MSKKEQIGIVGTGLVGRSWAMLFASRGYRVVIYDIEDSQVKNALEDIKVQLHELEKQKMLRGSLTAKEQYACIRGTQSLEECVSKSKHVQECVPEDVEMKKKVFKLMDELAGSQTVLSSSTSCILPSKFTEGLVHKTNCIVSHPVNPPYYVPLVEVVPAPWTSKDVVHRTCSLLKEIQMSPIAFSKEHPGFGLNRIQYAILNECWHLVNDGILTTEDVDKLMTDGLAMRYAWMGPLETAHLNAEGMENYIERYGSTIAEISNTMKPIPSWKNEDAKDIVKQLETRVPLDRLQERRGWRENRLIALSVLQKSMKEKED